MNRNETHPAFGRFTGSIPPNPQAENRKLDHLPSTVRRLIPNKQGPPPGGFITVHQPSPLAHNVAIKLQIASSLALCKKQKTKPRTADQPPPATPKIRPLPWCKLSHRPSQEVNFGSTRNLLREGFSSSSVPDDFPDGARKHQRDQSCFKFPFRHDCGAEFCPVGVCLDQLASKQQRQLTAHPVPFLKQRATTVSKTCRTNCCP